MSKRQKSYTKKVEHKENVWLLPVIIIALGIIIALVVLYSDHQNTPTPDNKGSISGILSSYASEVGLDVAEFNSCLASSKYADVVEDDYQAAMSYDVNSTPSFFINGTPITGAQSASAFTEAIEAELAKEEKNPDAIGAGYAEVKGNPDADVMIVEFTDYDCPFCAKYARETLPVIEAKYIETGKVKYAVRNLPLEQLHPHTRKEAEASLCANDQGLFWEYHDILFKNSGTRPTK